MNKTRLIIYILLSGFFLLLDQTLKYFARANPDFTYYLWQPWLGWEYFANSGIVFSLPFPNWLIIIATPIILLGLILWGTVSLRGGARATTKQSHGGLKKTINTNLPEIAEPVPNHVEGSLPRNDNYTLSLILILAGALSNYIDRIFFSATIDYLRVLTGVINLADVMIVGGVAMLFVCYKKSTKF